ncbi:hypothetical protein [Lacihabitans soyangensis]|uniref:Uncharacterized protein n=1 Tax=Lacihabitans soyangensis TaxID=869394 RepID=A0AAE3H3X5_9BACT|nr:hypothetical protein [Lacihabitans soyangensis]MCP9764492.1 hypothetical protein [Lacihabitans soyangensis]
MEKMHGGSANSGQVGRRLSLQDKAVIMWALDTLADNSMAYVKEVRMVIERQMVTTPQPPPLKGGGVVSRIAHAIRISKGLSVEYLVWMRDDQSSFVKGVVKAMMWLVVERYFSDETSAKSRYLDEYRKCGDVLNRF